MKKMEKNLTDLCMTMVTPPTWTWLSATAMSDINASGAAYQLRLCKRPCSMILLKTISYNPFECSGHTARKFNNFLKQRTCLTWSRLQKRLQDDPVAVFTGFSKTGRLYLQRLNFIQQFQCQIMVLKKSDGTDWNTSENLPHSSACTMKMQYDPENRSKSKQWLSGRKGRD